MTHIAQGWQCPQCRGIYAPSMMQCLRCGPKEPLGQQLRSPEIDRAYWEFLEARDKVKKKGCFCRKCRPVNLGDMRMVLCPTCGDKRCPHAFNHRYVCANSNPGAVGSVEIEWPDVRVEMK